MPGRATWIYGLNSLRSLIESRSAEIIAIHTARGNSNPRLSPIRRMAREQGIPCSEKPVDVLNQMTGGASHQGMVALCRLPEYLGERELGGLYDDQAIFLVLDRVTDPVNYGACLRNADAFGATATIVSSNNMARLTPAAVKVASGAVGRIPILQTSNLSRTIVSLKELGVWTIGTFAATGCHLTDIDCCRPVAFVMGAEGDGLRRHASSICDYRAMIPLSGTADSLNVSVASAICLYEAQRQRSSRE